MLNRIRKYIEGHRYSDWAVSLAKRVSIPGFKKVPVYDVLHFFIKELQDDKVTVRAAAVSFYFLLAIFPAILFLFSLIPLIPVEEFRSTLFRSMQQILPLTAFNFLQTAIDDIINVTRVDLLSIGFLLTFYFSTTGVHALTRTFRKSNPIFTKRTFFQRQWTAIKITLLLMLLVLLSVVLVIVGDQMLDKFLDIIHLRSNFSYTLLMVLRWTITLLTFYTAISMIYYFGPSTTKQWRFFTAGSTLATVLCILVSLVFAFFVNNFGLYNKIYGSIGALIAMILWIYMNTLILLIGFELNTSIYFNRDLRINRLKSAQAAGDQDS